MVALADAHERFSLPPGALGELIEGVRMDVDGVTYERFEDLVLYCRRVAGAIGRVCLAIFGAPEQDAAANSHAEALADDLGVALQLTNILRDVREDAENGRVYLPGEDLRRFGLIDAGEEHRAPVVLASLARSSPSGQAARDTGEAAIGREEQARRLSALVRFEAERAQQWFDRGIALAPLLDRRSAACVLAMAGIYHRLLDRIEAHPERVLHERMSLPPWEKAWVAAGSMLATDRGATPRELLGRQGDRWTPLSAGRRVLVIGGGLAGITAALDCADAGAEVTLLEVRRRLGGAAYSFERDGLQIDNGQHVFLRCCTAYRALLERLGSERSVSVQPRLSVPVLSPGGRTALLARNALPAPLHMAGALARYPYLTVSQRLGAARAALAIRRMDAADETLDRLTFGDWLARRGQGPDAVGALWDVIVRPTLNLPAAQASLALGAFVFRTALLSDVDAGDMGFHTAPLSETIGEPAERALRRAGVDVRLGWRAERLERTATGVECMVVAVGAVRRMRIEASARRLQARAARGGGVERGRGDRRAPAQPRRWPDRASARSDRAAARRAGELADRQPARGL